MLNEICETNLNWNFPTFAIEDVDVDDLLILIGSIAIGILVSSCFVIFSSASPCVIVVGAVVGLLLAITIVACRRFHFDIPLPLETPQIQQDIPAVVLAAVQQPPRDLLPINLPQVTNNHVISEFLVPEVFPQIFSYSKFTINMLRIIACVSKGCHEVIYQINEERLKTIQMMGKLIGRKIWERHRWEFNKAEKRSPLIFPDIVQTLGERELVLLLPKGLDIGSVDVFGGKHADHFNEYSVDLVHKKIPGNQSMVRQSYFAIISTTVLDGSANKSFAQQRLQVSQYRKDEGLYYRIPKLIEVMALIHFCERSCDAVLFKHVWTRTIDRIDGDTFIIGCDFLPTFSGTTSQYFPRITECSYEEKRERVGSVACRSTAAHEYLIRNNAKKLELEVKPQIID